MTTDEPASTPPERTVDEEIADLRSTFFAAVGELQRYARGGLFLGRPTTPAERAWAARGLLVIRDKLMHEVLISAAMLAKLATQDDDPDARVQATRALLEFGDATHAEIATLSATQLEQRIRQRYADQGIVDRFDPFDFIRYHSSTPTAHPPFPRRSLSGR